MEKSKDSFTRSFAPNTPSSSHQNEYEYGKFNGDDDSEDDDNDAFDFMTAFLSKVKLNDGTEEYIFSSGVRGLKKSFFPINCHLCQYSNIRKKSMGDNSLRAHVASERHQALLKGPPPNAKQYRMPLSQPFGRITNPIKIYPGEMIKLITPEYYDRVLPIVEYQFEPCPPEKHLEELANDPIHDYNQNAPVIGLSYAVKMKTHNKNDHYFCFLCQTNVIGEPFKHFVSTSHIMEYVKFHFNKTHKYVSEFLEKYFMDNNSYKKKQKVKTIIDIFRHLYRRIELVKGLRKIGVVNQRDFKEKFHDYRKIVQKRFSPKIHYWEHSIEFPDGELDDLLTKAIKGEQIMEPDAETLLIRFNNYEKENSKSSNIAKETCSKNSENSLFHQSSGELIWDRYRKMVQSSLADLDELYDDYETYPEKHPMYKYDWRRFWQFRCREMQKDNIDPRGYNFKPEWEQHWSKLFKEYYRKDVDRRKFEARNVLKLSQDIRTPSPEKEDIILLKNTHEKTTEESHIGDERKKGIINDDDANEIAQKKSSSIIQRGEGKQKVEENIIDKQHQQLQKQPQQFITVISVLRLLAPLEDELGSSLGPKAIKFLGKAVLFEKNGHNDPKEFLKDDKYYMFFVTAKEKLEAQEMTGVMPFDKIAVAQKAINALNIVIQIFDDYKMEQFPSGNFINFDDDRSSSTEDNDDEDEHFKDEKNSERRKKMPQQKDDHFKSMEYTKYHLDDDDRSDSKSIHHGHHYHHHRCHRYSPKPMSGKIMIENKEGDENDGSSYDRQSKRRKIAGIEHEQQQHKNQILQDRTYRFHKVDNNSQAISEAEVCRNKFDKKPIVGRIGYLRFAIEKNELQQQNHNKNTFENNEHSEPRFSHHSSPRKFPQPPSAAGADYVDDDDITKRNSFRRSRSLSQHKNTPTSTITAAAEEFRRDNKNWMQFRQHQEIHEEYNNPSNCNNNVVHLTRKHFIDSQREHINERDKFFEFRQQEKFPYSSIVDNPFRGRAETIGNNINVRGSGGGQYFNVSDERNFGNYMEEQNQVDSLNFNNFRMNRGRSQFFGGRRGGAISYRGGGINRRY